MTLIYINDHYPAEAPNLPGLPTIFGEGPAVPGPQRWDQWGPRSQSVDFLRSRNALG